MADRVQSEFLVDGVSITNDLVEKAFTNDWNTFCLYMLRILSPDHERKDILKMQDDIGKMVYARNKIASKLNGDRAIDPRKLPIRQEEFKFDDIGMDPERIARAERAYMGQ